MVFRNNNFTKDTDGNHLLRAQNMSDGLTDHGADLAFTNQQIVVFQGYPGLFSAALTEQADESADVSETYALLHEAEKKAREQYRRCQQVIQGEMAVAVPATRICLEERFDIYGDLPRRQADFLKVATKILTGYDYIVAEHPEIVLPAAPFDDLRTFFNAMDTNIRKIDDEVAESREASVNKSETRIQGEKYLRQVYHRAVAFWGDNDSKLLELGFVPASMIWTENKPPHPKNFAHDGMKFSWDAVVDVDEYEIDERLTGASGDWTQLYKGAATSTTDRPPDAGEYDFRIRSWADDDSGAWSGVIVVNFSGGALVGVPTGFIFDDVKQEFSWDYMELALLYELEISRDEGQTWVQKYKDIDEYFNAGHLDTGKALARVRALDGYQEPGDWTEPLEVTFILLAPAFVAYSQYKNEFVWNWVPLADGYELELDYGGGFIQIYKGPNNHVVHDLAEGVYKMRVHAGRGGVHSAWSKEYDVVIQFDMPAGLLYDPNALKIKWDKVPGAVQYQLMNESHTVNYIGADNFLDIELTAPENFRVRAGDGTMLVWGEWTDWITLG